MGIIIVLMVMLLRDMEKEVLSPAIETFIQIDKNCQQIVVAVDHLKHFLHNLSS